MSPDPPPDPVATPTAEVSVAPAGAFVEPPTEADPALKNITAPGRKLRETGFIR